MAAVRRDRIALASGVFIILIVLPPSSAARSPSAGSATARTTSDHDARTSRHYLPAGPWSHVTENRRASTRRWCWAASDLSAATSSCGCSTARGCRSRWPSWPPSRADHRGAHRRARRLLRRIRSTSSSRAHRDRDGVPVPVVPRRHRGTVGARLNNITSGVFTPGVFTLVLVLGAVLMVLPGPHHPRRWCCALREKEFVEAARMVGAANFRIIAFAPAAAPDRADHRVRDVDHGAINILAETTLLVPRASGFLPDPTPAGASC